jgi:hypothetical protein
LDNGIHRICLTPTRNEAWIVERFLAAAKCWASHIIVVDQQSSDETLPRLTTTPGVEVVINESPAYDESYRQNLLISRARAIPGKRVLIALDADEALSANCISSDEWARVCEAKPGTVLRFRWVNVLPGFEQAWIPTNRIACGFVDDGSIHEGHRIHSRRVPWPKCAPVLDLDEVVVLHFQYVAWDRVMSKQRWYQVWEWLNNPGKSALEIFRQYHHMDGSWKSDELHSMKPEWLEGYREAGIDFRSLVSEAVTWWDRDIIQLLLKHGTKHFRKIAIWDKDWDALAKRVGVQGGDLADPRSTGEKIAHRMLGATQKHRTNWGVRGFERILRTVGW